MTSGRDIKISTWEEAARWAADQSVTGVSARSVNADQVPHVEHFYNLGVWSAMAGHAVVGLMQARGYAAGDRFSDEDTDALVAHLAGKQHDYGHDNIQRFGIDGLRVRLWDKIARLKNLLAKGTAARHEALEDTWLDIVGYGVIAHMVESNVFVLPLASDVKPPERRLAYYHKGGFRGVFAADEGLNAAFYAQRLMDWYSPDDVRICVRFNSDGSEAIFERVEA